MAGMSCKDRAMALTVLDTIAASMTGTQREAVLAVKSWIEENVPDFSRIAQVDYSKLTDEELKKIIAWADV
jgi:hypothetical protein